MLNERSKSLRREIIKLSKANSGYHFGGSFSCVEILIALFDNVMDNMHDRFILSKGHACWGYYVLLREQGYNPKLEGHPSRGNGVICTTGSMGHGLPTAVGIAMAKKLKGEEGKVYVLMGDGECQEGTTWESLLIARHHKLDNLKIIVDFNGIQGSGYTKDILPIHSLIGIAHNLNLIVESIDGHNMDELTETLSADHSQYAEAPHFIVAETIKGKGVSFMEDKPEWHAHWLCDTDEEIALKELKSTGSFEFLDDKEEDIYTTGDGELINIK